MQITKDVYMLENTVHSHVYLITGDSPALIDTGLPGFAPAILKEAVNLHIEPSSIGNILLTHHDIDHTGSALELAKQTGAHVWISALDEPYFTGKQKRPGFRHIIETLLPAAVAPCHVYTRGQAVGGIKILPASGHTPGHVMLQYGSVLFTGDLFRTRDGKPCLMPGWFTWDKEAQDVSLLSLRKLDFEWVCPAHGKSLKNGPCLEKFLSEAEQRRRQN